MRRVTVERFERASAHVKRRVKHAAERVAALDDAEPRVTYGPVLSSEATISDDARIAQCLISPMSGVIRRGGIARILRACRSRP